MNGRAFRLAIDRGALKFLKAVKKGDPKVARRLAELIQALPQDPLPAGSRRLTDRKLGGLAVHRLRSGPYRILYVVNDERREIRVLEIGHRREVYRDLS